MRTSLLVFVGAGIGGVARHFFNSWVMRAAGTSFPLGILLINVAGSTAMGLVAGWFAFRSDASQSVRLFLTTGILGGFTTFSAFSLDAALLYQRGELQSAVLYVLSSVLFSIAGVFAGMWAMRT